MEKKLNNTASRAEIIAAIRGITGEVVSYRQADDLHGPSSPRPIVVMSGSRYLRAYNGRQLLTTGLERSPDNLALQFLLSTNNRYCRERQRNHVVLCVRAADASTFVGR